MFVNEHMEKMQMGISIKTVQMNDASEKKWEKNMVKFEERAKTFTEFLSKSAMTNDEQHDIGFNFCRVMPHSPAHTENWKLIGPNFRCIYPLYKLGFSLLLHVTSSLFVF